MAGLLLATTVRGSDQLLPPAPVPLWADGIGNGFSSGTQTVGAEAGLGGGVRIFGGRQLHHLALADLSYGRMLGPVWGGDHWYRGNWELRAEFFGGSQFSPRPDYLIGLTPHLRYELATGTRWVPFVDGGAGVTATGIGAPDLSNKFEFNLNLGGGTHWFFRDNAALTFEVRYLHISDAGLTAPNDGVNDFVGLAGVTWFF